jgi:hypothetical protein
MESPRLAYRRRCYLRRNRKLGAYGFPQTFARTRRGRLPPPPLCKYRGGTCPNPNIGHAHEQRDGWSFLRR